MATKLARWVEPMAFTKARAKDEPWTARDYAVTFLLHFAIMAAMCIALAWSKAWQKAGEMALLSAAAAFVFTLLAWVMQYMPRQVWIGTEHIIVGRRAFRFAEVEFVQFGTKRLGGREHRVFSFRDRRGVDRVLGLPSDFDVDPLATELRAFGLDVRT